MAFRYKDIVPWGRSVERIEVRKVDYEFQIGGNEMLIIKKTLGHKIGG